MKMMPRLVMLVRMNRHVPLLIATTACLLFAGCTTMRSSVVVEPASRIIVSPSFTSAAATRPMARLASMLTR